MSQGTNSSPGTQKTILAIAGSFRVNSYNHWLLRASAEYVPAAMRIHLYTDLGSIPLFNEDAEQSGFGGPEAVRRLRNLIASSDGLLIATPEYNQSIPGVLKNAIDWLSRPAPDEVLAGKPVAIIGASSGRWGTRLAQSALRQVFYATESLVLPTPMIFVREAEHAFNESGQLTDTSIGKALETMLASFARWIDLVAKKSTQNGNT